MADPRTNDELVHRWVQLSSTDDESSLSLSDVDDGDDEPQKNTKKRQKLMVIALHPGRRAIRRPEDVSFAMGVNLRDLVHEAKLIHYKSTNLDTTVTDHDINQLLEAVFAGGWITGQIHRMCGKYNIQPNVNDVAPQLGLFSKAIGAILTKPKANLTPAKATSGTKKTRPHTATAHKVLKLMPKRTTAAHSSSRQVTAPVYLGCMEDEGKVTFVYYDRDHKLLPNAIQKDIKLHAWTGSLTHAKAQSVQLHDKFWMTQGREYNLRAAVYLARNRLTHWANGKDPASRQWGEHKELFVPYTLMHNLECSDQAVMDMCREMRVPLLWEGMEGVFLG